MCTPNFAAGGRAEQKHSRNFGLRAAVENLASSFRTVWTLSGRTPSTPRRVVGQFKCGNP